MAYTPRRMVHNFTEAPYHPARVYVGQDGQKYRVLAVHPSKDIVTLTLFPKHDLRDLVQVAPAFIGHKIIGGQTHENAH